MKTEYTYTVFDGNSIFVRGTLHDVVLKIKRKLGDNSNNPLLIFSDETGKTMDFNFQGSEHDVSKRLEVFVSNVSSAQEGPGRPRLGVVSREVSLLPRHWEWLATQSGGASVTLRKLVEAAQKGSFGKNTAKASQEKTHAFMSAIAGDLKGYEDALRALYRADKASFETHTQTWPKDIRSYAKELTQGAF